jgi:hypothetical protein
MLPIGKYQRSARSNSFAHLLFNAQIRAVGVPDFDSTETPRSCLADIGTHKGQAQQYKDQHQTSSKYQILHHFSSATWVG